MLYQSDLTTSNFPNIDFADQGMMQCLMRYLIYTYNIIILRPDTQIMQ